MKEKLLYAITEGQGSFHLSWLHFLDWISLFGFWRCNY